MSRIIEQLLQFIEEDPSDPFNHYALALEYSKTNEKLALQTFQQVVKDHKEYIPVYYQLAILYGRLGEKEKAIQIFNQGIVIARNQNDFKTLRELNAALKELVEDHDE